MVNKPFKTFRRLLGFIDAGNGIKVAHVDGYGGYDGLTARTSHLVSTPEYDKDGNVVRFETSNSVYIRRNDGSATP